MSLLRRITTATKVIISADMTRTFPILTLLAALVGCAGTSTAYEPPIRNRDRVTVNTAFENLANGSKIQLQDGRRITEGNLDKWTTWCDLYVYNKHHEADYVTSIQPGEFEIVGVRVRHSGSDHLDRPGRYRVLGYHYNHLPAFYLYHVGMRLTSADQPDLQAIDCYKKWATRGRYYPTFVEIQQALGNLVEIRPRP